MGSEGWVLPLTLIPGIGLFIMSTSALSTALSNEISYLLREEGCDRSLLHRKIDQLSRINTSMILLYVSGGCFAISGLVGVLNKLDQPWAAYVSTGLLVLGVAAFVVACAYLVVFSVRMLRIKRRQFEEKL